MPDSADTLPATEGRRQLSCEFREDDHPVAKRRIDQPGAEFRTECLAPDDDRGPATRRGLVERVILADEPVRVAEVIDREEYELGPVLERRVRERAERQVHPQVPDLPAHLAEGKLAQQAGEDIRITLSRGPQGNGSRRTRSLETRSISSIKLEATMCDAWCSW